MMRYWNRSHFFTVCIPPVCMSDIHYVHAEVNICDKGIRHYFHTRMNRMTAKIKNLCTPCGKHHQKCTERAIRLWVLRIPGLI